MTANFDRLTRTGVTHINFSDADFQALAAMARRDIGLNLTENKKPLIYSRLAPRLKARAVQSFTDYLTLLDSKGEHEERRAMISALTTNVTSFFREHHHFETLRTECLPDVVERVKNGGRLRLWSAGCSSGQEAYCLAMTLLEFWPGAPSGDARILATDIDPKIITSAKSGVYKCSELDSLTEKQRFGFFRKTPDAPDCLEVTPAIRDLVSFAELNLMSDWPFKGPFDAIFCRNVAIYFDTETQQVLWDRFCDFLAPGGFLFIGHSERITGPAESRLQVAGTTCFRKRAD